MAVATAGREPEFTVLCSQLAVECTMGARWSVFLLVSVVVIGSVSSAQAGEWGETCQQYFTSVERFCEVANAIPKFADKCETVQRAVADMKALADEVDPMRVEEVCVTANASLLMTIEALERSPSLAKASAAKASVDSRLGPYCQQFVADTRERCAVASTTCDAALRHATSLETSIALNPSSSGALEAGCKHDLEPPKDET